MKAWLALGGIPALVASAQAPPVPKPDRATFHAAVEEAQQFAAKGLGSRGIQNPEQRGRFTASFGSALFSGGWIIQVEGTRIRYRDEGPMDVATQLALMHLAQPKAEWSIFLPKLVLAGEDLTLRRLKVEGPTFLGVAPGVDALDDSGLDDLFWKLRASPMPLGRAWGEAPGDGFTLTITDGWPDKPLVHYSSSDIPQSDPEGKWSELPRSAWAFRDVLWNRWEARLRRDQFRPVFDQITSIEIQGPAWFQVAVRHGWVPLVQGLLHWGLDPRKPGPEGITPLVEACGLKDETALAELFGEFGSPLGLKPQDGRTPMLVAVSSVSYAGVSRLLSLGADPNETFQEDAPEAQGLRTPLEVAVSRGDLDIIKLLVRAGAQSTEKARALGRGHQGVVEALTLKPRGKVH